MKKKIFEVKIYYSGSCACEIEATNEEEAILQARQLEINKNELLTNLENWKEADSAIEIENEDIKK